MSGDNAQEWIEFLKWRMGDDQDNVILIDGYEGKGKSTLALHILQRLSPDWQPKENVIFQKTQLTRLFQTLPKQTTILVDEGANVLFSRNSMGKMNKWFGRFLFQCRQLNNTVIFCIPNKRWLDSIGREHRAQYWIHVHSRGNATLLERRENWYAGSVYYVPVMDFTFQKFSGPKWTAYKKMKDDAMIMLGETEAPPKTWQEQAQDAERTYAYG